MNSVIHFEMPYKNHERLAKFYSQAFGWQMNHLGQEYGGYVMAMTAESGECGSKVPNTINGGFYDKNTCPDQEAGNQVVIGVENLGAAMQRVRDAGGRVLMDPMQIPNVGMYAVFTDTEGNRVAMLEPQMANK